MTTDQLASTTAQLTELAILSLDLTGLDEFIEATLEDPEHRELAIAVANLQRVAHRQLCPSPRSDVA